MIRILKTLLKKRPTVNEDGGVRKYIDRDASKHIVSKLIISFECVFSTVAIAEEIPIKHGIYTLSAKLKDGAVRGEYKLRTRDGGGEEFLFRNSHMFMRELQSIVTEYNFAAFNGEEYFVSGLPDMYGAKISIVYASGESIYANNNQDCFLPVDAMTDLVELFNVR